MARGLQAATSMATGHKQRSPVHRQPEPGQVPWPPRASGLPSVMCREDPGCTVWMS